MLMIGHELGASEIHPLVPYLFLAIARAVVCLNPPLPARGR